jgi:hypothetical protein
MEILAGLCALACEAAASASPAQTPEVFRDADLSLGDKLTCEHRGAKCHARPSAFR